MGFADGCCGLVFVLPGGRGERSAVGAGDRGDGGGGVDGDSYGDVSD